MIYAYSSTAKSWSALGSYLKNQYFVVKPHPCSNTSDNCLFNAIIDLYPDIKEQAHSTFY